MGISTDESNNDPSTGALQTTGNSSLSSIDTKLNNNATTTLQTTGNNSLSSIDGKTPALVSGRVPVDGSGVTQPISAVALPLPSGASTSALQTTGNTSLSSIDTKLTNNATSTLQTSLNTLTGAVNETAPTTDTESSGLNGRLQRIAQRLTSIFTSLSDGTQQSKILGNTDATLIGNVSDYLKVTGSFIPADSTLIPVSSYFLFGTVKNMVYDGSVTSRQYTLQPPAGQTWYITSLSVIIADNGTPDFDEFGNLGSALSNGVLIESNINSSLNTFSNLTDNGDVNLLFNKHAFSSSGWLNNSDLNLSVLEFPQPITISQSRGDYLRATVRDNLIGLDAFRIFAQGYRVI